MATRQAFRRIYRIATFLFVLALLVGGLLPAQAFADEKPRLLPELSKRASKDGESEQRVIVLRAGKDKNDRAADALVKSKGYGKVKDITGGFVARVKGKDLGQIAKHKSVKWVTIDAEMASTAIVDSSKLATDFNLAIGSQELWAQNITGAGVGIAVIDTGIINRSDFNGASGSRIAGGALFNTNPLTDKDGHGHGTHVAGVAAGNSWHSSVNGKRGKYIGVAPEATLVDARVSSETGASNISDVIEAIDWIIANRQTYNIRVLNLSLISSVAESYTTSPLAAAVERAWFSGIFVVVAAGNLGANTMLYPPANYPFVMTVGAADTMGTNNTAADDTIPFWSSYGTTQDGHSKPEILAPGRSIVGPLASSRSRLAATFGGRVVESTYIKMSGTSMAAPVVAGLAALAFQRHPEWTNDALKWLMINTARPVSTSVGTGAGLISATAVVNYAGTPGQANGGFAINQNLVGPDGTVSYSTTSWSTTSWSTTSWSTTSWSTTSWSTTSWSTTSWSAATTQSSEWQSVEIDGAELVGDGSLPSDEP